MSYVDSEIILQIFSGGFSGGAVSYEVVEKKLLSALPGLNVKKVIMGWAPEKALYEKTAELLAKRNIEFYLWFPVFSETGTIRPLQPLVDLWDRQLAGPKGGVAINDGVINDGALDGGAINGGEDFSFCCPNSPRNIEKILDIFESEFASIPFTGIFLDKIRYPSFAQEDGMSGVFSCFCPHCQGKYFKAKFNFENLKEALSRRVSAPLGITNYRGNGYYVFEDPVIAEFFSLKAAFIYRYLAQLCDYFRERGLKIGFDVFAPFLSPFVAQDLPKLSELCDFMKPMMYRLTNAPAGLPFETDALLWETGCVTPHERQRFYDLLGLNSREEHFDLAFAVKELTNLNTSSACPIYAGMEINRKKDIAEVYPDYIEETARAYAGTGIRGLTLSWDLLEAPEENIEAVKKI